MKRVVGILLCLILGFSVLEARTTSKGNNPANFKPHIEVKGAVSDYEMYPIQAAAAQGTTYLAYYTFDAFPSCVDQGWASHDMTAQIADFFHVTDFTTAPDDCGPGDFGRLYPLQGIQSLWCGACPTTEQPLCSYNTLPGYGNDWTQAFCTKSCVFVDSFATVDYSIMWDSEPGYDVTTVEYDLCDDNWTALSYYDDTGGPAFVSDAIPVSMDSIRVRFYFRSDGAWSDEDGQWDTDGAVIIDSLTVRCAGAGIVVPTELFEDEPLGDTDATDWESCTPPGFGDYSQLIRAVRTTYQNDPVQEDPCASNFSCMWNFIKGSTYNYACNKPNPSPQQAVVPYPDWFRDMYIHNEIWSPWIPLTGSGTSVNLEFDVYRDLGLDAFVFYVWRVTSKDSGGTSCLPWVDRGWIYWGSDKAWYRHVLPIGDLIAPGATHIRISLGVVDLCRELPYCLSIPEYPDCHSHSPMFDNVAVYRVAAPGPMFSLRDIDMFQDNFSTDGTITGPARADMAQDILGYTSPSILPGDSVCITADDPEAGLAGDAFTGCGPAVYCYLSVDPLGQPGKTGIDIQAAETRGACGTRFPYVTSTPAAGRTWLVFRMDSCFTSEGDLLADKYCIDFNDDIFTPGDTCWFFFGAKNSTGTWMYSSLPSGQTASLNQAATYPDEFTILPAVGDLPGNCYLYVDGMNFRGAQPYFDTAFQSMNVLDNIDRYDIRGPDSGAGNRPGSRVVNVINQMIPIYRVIIWNTGDLTLGCIGDGVGYEKSDDATLLFNWIDLHPQIGVIHFSGDDIASEWATLTGAGAVALRSYCSYTIVNKDHAAHGLGINPKVVGVPGPGAMFAHGAPQVPDSMIAFGGCPSINDFDVLANVLGLSDLQMVYVEDPDRAPVGPTTGGAIVSQTTTNTAGYDVTIILSGFSFHQIRDIDSDGQVERSHHMWDILTREGYLDEPTPVLAVTRKNSLAQNYPNPFNPITTIKYIIKEPAFVSLRIYNVAGQLVKTLVNQKQRPEEVKPVEWDGLNNAGQPVSSGVYFYKLVTKNFTQTKKMVLLK